MLKNIIKRIFVDKDGKIVLFQAPNAPLIIWFLSSVLARVFKNGDIHTVFQIVAAVSLIIWALLELFKGVTYFRRFLGFAVLVAVVFNLLHA